jgi:hypothetical protein
VYATLEESQKGDLWCQGLVQGLERGDPAVSKFKIHNKLLLYKPKGAKMRRYLVPELLRSMLMAYFRDSSLSGHLETFKTWRNVGRQVYWPKFSICETM